MKCQCSQCKTVLNVPSEHEGKTLRCRTCQNLFEALPLKERLKKPAFRKSEDDNLVEDAEPPQLEDWIKTLNVEPASPPTLATALQRPLSKRPAILAIAGCLWGIAMFCYVIAILLFVVLLEGLSHTQDWKIISIIILLTPVSGIFLLGTLVMAVSRASAHLWVVWG